MANKEVGVNTTPPYTGEERASEAALKPDDHHEGTCKHCPSDASMSADDRGKQQPDLDNADTPKPNENCGKNDNITSEQRDDVDTREYVMVNPEDGKDDPSAESVDETKHQAHEKDITFRMEGDTRKVKHLEESSLTSSQVELGCSQRKRVSEEHLTLHKRSLVLLGIPPKTTNGGILLYFGKLLERKKLAAEIESLLWPVRCAALCLAGGNDNCAVVSFTSVEGICISV